MGACGSLARRDARSRSPCRRRRLRHAVGARPGRAGQRRRRARRAPSTSTPHAVMSEQLAPAARSCPPDWALQDPDDYIEVLRHAVPAARRGAGRRPRQRSSASAPTSPPAPCCRCSPTARRCAELPAWREHPHAYVKLWKHHAAQPQADRINDARRTSAASRGSRRYGGRISSEWEFAKALQLLEEDPEVYARDGPLGRGRRLDHLAAVRRRDAQRVHRRLQGHLPGRPLPERGLPGRAQPALRRLRRRQAEPAIAPARRARGLADRAGGGAGPACPRASRSRSATSTRTSPRPRPASSRPGRMVAIMGTSTCHVMNRRRELAEVPGMCGVVRRRDRRRAAGATRPARAASATSSPGSSSSAVPPAYHERGARARHQRARTPDRAGARRRRSARTACIALDWWSGNRSVLVDHELTGVLVGHDAGDARRTRSTGR